ncbi:hypothetical protein LA345_12625 [Burkholderia vietnamiensis]|nr:hypothetical protein [Burkholderia vietnamiensis]
MDIFDTFPPLFPSNVASDPGVHPFDTERAERREKARKRGGRVALDRLDPATGLCLRSPEGVPHEALLHRDGLFYVGHPAAIDVFVAPTCPYETAGEAWDALVEAMAIHQPGRVVGEPIGLYALEVATPPGLVQRGDRLEVRDLGRGFEIFIVTAITASGGETCDVAQSRFHGINGRTPLRFDDEAAARALAVDYAGRVGKAADMAATQMGRDLPPTSPLRAAIAASAASSPSSAGVGAVESSTAASALRLAGAAGETLAKAA